MTSTEAEEKLTEYARAFIQSYCAAIDENFAATKQEILDRGLRRDLFSLYAREVGRNVALVALTTNDDFYLFFIDESGAAIKLLQQAGAAEGFGREWTFNTPYDKRVRRVMEHLGLSDDQVLDCVNVPGTNFIAASITQMLSDARHHGSGFGNRDGEKAESQLPTIRAAFQEDQARAGLKQRYQALLNWTSTPQSRGLALEKLWRDALAFYNWHPKKVNIAGEDNDFTAIYKGLHILGEVRWHEEPMTGSKMREFLSKLDPRPQTIGLFVSHSGLDGGAWSVIRRAVNSKTVVVFDEANIEMVLLRGIDPGGLFDEKLRDVYDYLFERPSTQ